MGQKVITTSVLATRSDITVQIRGGWKVSSISPPHEAQGGAWLWDVFLTDQKPQAQEVIEVNVKTSASEINAEIQKGWTVVIESQSAPSPDGVEMWLVILEK